MTDFISTRKYVLVTRHFKHEGMMADRPQEMSVDTKKQITDI